MLNLADWPAPDPSGPAAQTIACTRETLEQWAQLIGRSWWNAGEHTRLMREAGTDALTGLGNYRVFTDRLAQEVARAKRYRTPLSMILLDVDSLKQVNDTHGHPAGDVLLKTVAARLADEIRHIDQGARTGGDEFAVLLPNTDAAAARAVAERVIQQVRRRPVRWQGQTIQPAVSVGVGQYDPDLSPREFVHKVDQSLYAAKDSGRNRVALYES
ncbi:MAG: GGDEF domain-containing protein [Phycisphaerae bacterium]|nr:GGDEF domain-containing protein [Phycisphaerae bacterium]